jgi:hypothetical protein
MSFKKLSGSPRISKGERFLDAFKVMIEHKEMPAPSPAQWVAIFEYVENLEAQIENNRDWAHKFTHSVESEKRAFRIAKEAFSKITKINEPETYGINPEKLK